MDKYKPGTVFELYENDDQEYMIVSNLEKENNVYILVIPVSKGEKTLKTDYSKLMLLKVDKETDDIEIETNKDIISEIVKNTMEKMED